MKQKTVKPGAAERWWLYITAAIVLFLTVCFDNNGSYITQKATGLIGVVGILCMLLFAKKRCV